MTGAGGQVGRALAAAAPEEVIGLDRGALDITDLDAVRQVVAHLQPDGIINTAAYTAVDRAESEPDVAFAVNRDGAANLAGVCAEAGLPLLHISTDYVFDGTKATPYAEGDAANPKNVYGQSKWEGEEAIRARIDRHLILRTAWVFDGQGPNFVQTILRLAREREALRIVADQHGHPTPASAIADALLYIARRAQEPAMPWGTYHFAGQPPTTWFGFAEAIVEEARQHEPLAVQAIEPIATTDYPTPARRPSHTLLDTSRAETVLGLAMPMWRAALRGVVALT